MDKKSFILHMDSLGILDDLTNEEAGELFKAIYSFHNNTIFEISPLIKMAFYPFRNQFIRDNEKWDEITGNKSLSGRMGNIKRWHPDLYKKIVENEIDILEAERIAEGRKGSQGVANIAGAIKTSQTSLVSVSVSVNDSVSSEKDFFVDLLVLIKEILGKTFRSKKEEPSFLARLKEGFTIEQFRLALENIKNDSYHKETKYKHITPEFICRIDKLEKFINIQPTAPPSTANIDFDILYGNDKD